VNAEFNWWLLIVGLVVGAALTWLVMADSVRRDIDVGEVEQRGEARWIAKLLAGAGRAVPAERVEEILRLHREYLAAPPPDEPIDPSAAPPRSDLSVTPDVAPDSLEPRGPGVAQPEARLEQDR
jgi:hypothetical protein